MPEQPSNQQLQASNQRLQAEVAILLVRIKELESRLNQHSGNSSMPPSTDQVKRVVKNTREKSGKRAGAQPGHKVRLCRW